MKTVLTLAIAVILLIPGDGRAAEKAKSQALIDSARIALNEFKAKAGDDKNAAGIISEAGSHIDAAAEALKTGEKFLGFGGISDEGERDVQHETTLANLVLKRGASRVEQAKTTAESAILAKKIDAVKAKVKIFDDFRSEIAQLKKEVAANEKAAKEVVQLKADKTALEEKVVGLTAELEKLEVVKAENSKLKSDVGKLDAELKTKAAEAKAAEAKAAEAKAAEAKAVQLPIQVPPAAKNAAPITTPIPQAQKLIEQPKIVPPPPAVELVKPESLEIVPAQTIQGDVESK